MTTAVAIYHRGEMLVVRQRAAWPRAVAICSTMRGCCTTYHTAARSLAQGHRQGSFGTVRLTILGS